MARQSSLLWSMHWSELFVGSAAANHTETKTILSNVSGVLKPGTITLLLGQPGSGKSSLIKSVNHSIPPPLSSSNSDWGVAKIRSSGMPCTVEFLEANGSE
ncbi:ABC transporter G family member 38 [Phytophthora citrophthora]|uniref:ABC transporter G family member 38 n=1 Tax=Phytophthora citrophthora TaxID=4793 RepID=A0AAD9LD69_9STRA|nr:ABC transporter G family member 38 [Phytophthora citrophthora]